MLNSNPYQFRSEVINLKNLPSKKFSIPTYQRPFVWNVEQIDKLLKDCAYAFSVNKEKSYFIGTILTNEKEDYYELIDGQQRFTTLWLVAFAYYKKKINSDIINFLRAGEDLRLDFEIRKEVSNYFDLLLKHPEEALTKFDSSELKEKPYLVNIVTAVTTITGILQTLKNPQTKELIHLENFGNYLYNQLKLVNNVTPDNEKFDLNKLFATVNNSGIQLEQTDIVKSNLLNKIKSDKLLYSKIWESCENMGEYFERNVRSIFSRTNWNKLKPEDFANFNPEIFLLGSEQENGTLTSGYSIDEILSGKAEEINVVLNEDKQEKPHEINCESIINFGQLLIHTYRIFRHRKRKEDIDGTFHIDRLISIFKSIEKESEEEIKEFLKLLWQIRYVFDANIIKWITDLDTKDRHLELTTITSYDNKGTTYFGRNTKERSEDLMLQSVLYFTGDYLRQYWLTPYLNFLLTKKENDIIELENIDNQMSLCKRSDKEASFLLMTPSFLLSKDLNLVEYLNKDHGTAFQHYWFLKLEYILWKNWEFERGDTFKKYRITSKNSVEHIFPQNPEFDDRLDKKIKDDFGNLVLLSVAQNSEYSRKQVNVKRAEFFSKTSYDTLKSYHIFNSYENEWNEETIKGHKEEMITYFIAHYTTSSYLYSPILE